MDAPEQSQQAGEFVFDARSMVEEVADAIASRRPLPELRCPDLASGYQFQRKLTAHINGGLPCDLKAGVTSAEVQQHFGLSGPLVGSLYIRGKLHSGCEVVVTDGQELEFEIAAGVEWIVSEARRWRLWREGVEGRTLFLGTCGKAMKASSGEYCADFGPLGEVRFAIRCRGRFEDTESLNS